jgi:hypothetical protein
LGKATRLDCVSCHDPHAPLRLFHLKPAPAPYPLHPSDEPGVAVEGEH